MPTVFESDHLPVTQDNHVKSVTLANRAMLGTDALQVERIELDQGTRSSLFPSADVERFIYVIRGNGQAYVGEQLLPLDAESVLWLEQEDAFYLESGASGIEVLLCHAPARE
jgi:redox-sensitive bicupin YhaK (pirin superfamily)